MVHGRGLMALRGTTVSKYALRVAATFWCVIVSTTDDDCTGDCGEGFGGWVTADPPDAEAIPYFVCKKPNV
ncbi:unnamed protein product, partial [Mesorhabditis belari]|uniref:Uncharacterized protein n=1 Tax=Mesorhabditis belari TaxID=2138241 RepID=A0AAF3EX68_9BILA